MSNSDITLKDLADLATPMAVRVAVTLRIAHRIAAGRRLIKELADDVDAKADLLERVLLHLVSVGLFHRDDLGAFSLTPLGEQMLVESGPGATPPWLDLGSALGRAEMSFTRLLETVMTGEVAYTAQYGRTFWEDLDGNPSWSAQFDAALARGMERRAREVAQAYDWAALGEVVDIGGGDGTLLVALLRAHPALRGTVVDRSPEPAKRTLQEAGLSERANVVAGSFFEPLPRGAGGYVLSRIQSNWSDADLRTILSRCAEASGAGGKVIVIDELVADVAVATESDLRMLVYFGGRERTAAHVRDVAADVGLSLESLLVVGDWTILELES
ncbi:methyltransferase [Micromonospora sp. CPCC 206061]|uniref:methyltransferase n=1 Tax=Micromonospora sp. CPCC 206061 TaxID=3122410 RepID=UPI002FF429D7